MKGILIKTEQGWVVNYNYSVNKNDWETLPLHPEFIEMMDTCFTSKFSQEVEFEIVRYCKKHNSDPSKNSVCTLDCGYDEISYAKITNQVPEVRKMVEDTYAWESPFNFVCQDPDCPHCGEEIRLMQEDEDDIDVANDKELFYQKQVMNPNTSDSPTYVAYEKGFMEGYNKAKETLYTEEQMMGYAEWIFNLDTHTVLTMPKEALLQEYISQQSLK